MRLLPKRLKPVAPSKATLANRNSIPNPTPDKPLLLEIERPHHYTLTLKDSKSRAFWVLFATLFISIAIAANTIYRSATWHSIFQISVYAVTVILPLTLLGAMYLDMNASRLEKLPLFQSLIRMLFVVALCMMSTTLLGKLVMYLVFGVVDSVAELIESLVINMYLAMLTMAVFFSYHQLQYRRINASQKLYQQQLIEQNEQLKARLTPHFFFNMLNSMQYLIEVNPKEAELLVRQVSNLYRASFEEIREVAILDEIKLCKNYLNIERYRFGDKLKVVWALPDEDLLYDMVITSRTLQYVLERMIVLVVEHTNSSVTLKIDIGWSDDIVKIAILAPMPSTGQADIYANIETSLDFSAPTETLRQYFGQAALIYSEASYDVITGHITYPLKDVAF